MVVWGWWVYLRLRVWLWLWLDAFPAHLLSYSTCRLVTERILPHVVPFPGGSFEELDAAEAQVVIAQSSTFIHVRSGVRVWLPIATPGTPTTRSRSTVYVLSCCDSGWAPGGVCVHGWFRMRHIFFCSGDLEAVSRGLDRLQRQRAAKLLTS